MATNNKSKTSKSKTVKTKSPRTSAKTKTASSKTKVPAKVACDSVKCHHPHHICFGIMMSVIGFAIFLALVVGLAFCLNKTKPLSDAQKFSKEYSLVSTENVFTYKTGEETIEVLKHGTGVVFLGFPSCPWCQAYAPMLNDLAKEVGIEKIYYHNTYDDWQNNTEEYKKITEILSSNLQYDDEGNRHLYVPDAVFVINGVIVGNDFETSKDTAGTETPEDYWTDERVENFNSRIKNYLLQVKTALDAETKTTSEE